MKNINVSFQWNLSVCLKGHDYYTCSKNTKTQTELVSIKSSSMLNQKPVERQTKFQILYHITIRIIDSLPAR